MARSIALPFPIRPSPDAPPDVLRTWSRLYKRLRWAVGNEADVKGNLRPGAKLSRLKREARLRGIEVTLTRDQYEELIARACVYCGAALPPAGHALDRIDSNRGYTPDNVVPACDTCNRVKADIFTFEQMSEIGRLFRRWRSEGRWTDPGRRRPGGRPRLGDLRLEIEMWNCNRRQEAADQRELPLGDGGASGHAKDRSRSRPEGPSFSSVRRT